MLAVPQKGTVMDYDVYINSNHWKVKRYWLADAKGWKCEGCGFTPFIKSQVEVHHKTYKNLGKETVDDIQILCRKCHSEKHPTNRYMNRELKRVFRKLGRHDVVRKLEEQLGDKPEVLI